MHQVGNMVALWLTKDNHAAERIFVRVDAIDYIEPWGSCCLVFMRGHWCVTVKESAEFIADMLKGNQP